MRARLLARRRPLELRRKAQHRAAVGLLALVVCDVLLEQVRDSHSYCKACNTLSLAARRAGKIAARIPTTTLMIAKTASDATGTVNVMKSTRATSNPPRMSP